MSEIYTLDQLRNMNQLDGNKELIFVEQIKLIIDSWMDGGDNGKCENYTGVYRLWLNDTDTMEEIEDKLLIRLKEELGLNTQNQNKENEVSKSG